MGGSKSDDPTSPAYIPSIFSFVKSPVKRTAEQSLVRYTRVTECKKRRTEAFERDIAAEEVRQKERLRMDEQDNLEEGRVSTTEEKTETSTMTALNLEENLEAAVEENTRLKIENASLFVEVGRLWKKIDC